MLLCRRTVLLQQKKQGKAIITAKCGKKKLTCKIIVNKIGFTKPSFTIKKNGLIKLVLHSGAIGGIKWGTSNHSVVKYIFQIKTVFCFMGG